MWVILKLRLLKLRESYLIIIVMTVMSLVLTFAFGGMSGNVSYTPGLLLVDEADNSFSEEIIDTIERAGHYKTLVISYDAAVEAVANSDYFAAVIIDESFGLTEKLEEGISVMALKDDVEIMTLQSNLASILTRMMQKERLASLGSFIFSQIPTVDAKLQEDNIKVSYDKQWLYRKPIDVESISSGDSGAREANTKNVIIGFAIMFSAYTMVFGIGDILTDKQEYTWHRMMVSPLKKHHVLLGYSIVTIIVGILQLTIIFFLGQFLFDVTWGEGILGMLVIILSYVFALTCMGLLLSTFVKTPSQLSAFTPIILTSFAMLGGCLWPLEIVTSKVLLALANITPHKWAMEAMTNFTIKGQPLSSSLNSILVLIAMGILSYGLSVYRLGNDAVN